MRRIRITQCVSALEFGGVDAVVYALATGLDSGRFAVSVFSLGPDRGAGVAYRAAGIPVYCANRGGTARAALAIGRLAHYLRAEGVELVHAHPGSASLLAALLAGPRGLVSTYHGVPDHRMGLAELSVRRFLERRVSAIVANSRATRDRIAADLRLSRERVRVIYNGVDVERFRPPSASERSVARAAVGVADDELLVATVARLYGDKGVADIVAAVAAAREAGVPVRLAVVGEGPERAALERQVSSLGVASAVTFLGPRGDVRAVLAAADVFTLASRTREGFGITLTEAMAMSLPVVATAVGGIPEVVEQRRTGVLVPPADPIALQGALVMLSRKPDLRLELGTRGRAAVESRFEVRRMVDAYAALYVELMDARPREPSL